MTTLRVFGARLLGTLTVRRRNAALSEEIETHLALLTEDFIARGLSAADARAAARREFGGVAHTRESAGDERGFRGIERALQDLSYGWRMIRKSPAFSLVIILSLAIGIGANTAIFSVVNAALLRPLRVPTPDDIYVMTVTGPATSRTAAGRSAQRISYPLFQQLQQAAPDGHVLAAMSRVSRMSATLTLGAEPERLGVHLVSADFFHALGLEPSLGTVLTARDVDTQNPVAVISHSLWERRFEASRDAIGRTLAINGTVITVIGVAPPSFTGVWLESPTDIWVPLSLQLPLRYWQNFSSHNANDQESWIQQEGIEWLDMIGRFPMVDARRSTEAALNVAFSADLERRLQRNLADPELREQMRQQHVTFESFARGSSNLRDSLASPLLLLQVAVVLTLLISCANAANLLLARAAARQSEIATRHALGASRRRIVRQLLTEGALLVAIAVALGSLIAQWGRKALAAGFGLPLPATFDAPLDRRVFGFTLGVAIVAGLFFALVPALRLSRTRLASVLGRDGAGARSTARLHSARALVSLQVALALVLAVGAGLTARTLHNLSSVDLGFDTSGVVSVWISPITGRVPRERLKPLYQQLVDQIEAVPGVRGAAVSTCQLLAGCHDSSGIDIAGRQPPPGESFHIEESFIGRDYLGIVGMRMVAGRDFDSRDSRTSPHVAIVNETMARQYFGRVADALGQRFGYGTPDIEIVGVVRDGRVASVRADPVPMAYYPLEQHTKFATSVDVAVQGDPHSLLLSIRHAVSAAAPELPVTAVVTLSDRVAQNLGRDQFVARLAASFGAIAIGLAGIGVFGMMSFAVARRTRELAVRSALGAQRSTILWMVFRESVTLIAAGVLVGLPATRFASRYTAGILFGITPTDPRTLAAATLAIIAIATVAGFGPAWRAAQANPMHALRQD